MRINKPLCPQISTGNGDGALQVADADALARTTQTAERPIEPPLGAGVEEGQVVAGREVAVPGNPDLHLLRVELEAGRARVVQVEQGAVELHVRAAGRLDARVQRRGHGGCGRDGGQQGAGGERDVRHEGGAAGACCVGYEV